MRKNFSAVPVFFQATEPKMKVCIKPHFLNPSPSQPSKLSDLSAYPRKDLLNPVRNWFANLEIHNSKMAHQICTFIPAQCPFERDVRLFGHTLFHIPPLCKLNPFYDQFVMLRFRALSFLVDQCGEDVTQYCR